jgi:hypothetical protein
MRTRDTCAVNFLSKRQPSCKVQLVVVFLLFVGTSCQLASFARTPGRSERLPASLPMRNAHEIPPGYILPAKLERTVSVERAQPGDAIEARIMQEVPLPNREKVAFRSVVKGSILSVARDEDEPGVELTLRFDRVSHGGQNIPVSTSLRAIASYVAVRDAQAPASVYDEMAPLGWANTVQIGGDVRFGDGDSVHNRWKETVGKAVPGGVLVYAKANPAMGCDGPPDENERTQALWLFSADACGVYGLKDVELIHNGQRTPVGQITLHFKKAKTKLSEGTGMLLLVVSRPEA